MADKAREWTDRELLKMEGHLRQIYKNAKAEITAKWDDYMERGQARLDDLYAAYTMAPADKKRAALKKYQDAARNYTLKNKWYREMVQETTYRLAHVNEIAIAYVNGKIPSIYVHNYNYIDSELANIGIKWTLRDEHTVRNLIRDSLPEKQLNYAKDMAWNTKQINSKVLQGILQGESIDAISRRILPVVNNNATAAIRTARTAVTGAENRGRFDRYHDYEDEGVVMTKIWLATPDGRTRDWHLSMDGQEVGVDEYFEDGLGNELEYPGDELAPGETVYNCRCSMKSHLIGIRDADGVVHDFGDFRGATLHDAQIAAERMARW